MFPNWTGWKSIKALLFALVTFNGVLMTASVFSPSTMKSAMVVSLFLGAAGTVVTTLSGTALATPSLARLARKGALTALAICFILGGALACQACSAAQRTQEVTLGVDTLVCVLNHDTDPPPTIAIECGVSDLTQIASILNAHKAAEIRDLSGVDAGAPHAANDVHPDLIFGKSGQAWRAVGYNASTDETTYRLVGLQDELPGRDLAPAVSVSP